MQLSFRDVVTMMKASNTSEILFFAEIRSIINFVLTSPIAEELLRSFNQIIKCKDNEQKNGSNKQIESLFKL